MYIFKYHTIVSPHTGHSIVKLINDTSFKVIEVARGKESISKKAGAYKIGKRRLFFFKKRGIFI